MSKIVDEAVMRMQMIGLFEPVIKDFKKHDRVQLSEAPLGACYWLDEAQQAVVDRFEATHHNYKVYHVVRTFTEFGELLSLLYVSDDTEEWQEERHDLSKDSDGMMWPICWVENMNAPELSEMGSIGVKLSPAAGLLRYY